MKKAHQILLPALLCLCNVVFSQCLEGDCQNGDGTFLFHSGAKYIGQFEQGKMSGQGLCFWPDGSRYQGQWLDGLPHGRGVKVLGNGKAQSGWFEAGRFVSENEQVETTAKQAAENQEAPTTGCISGDCFAGQGLYIFANGTLYNGEFQEGEIHGAGLCYYQDGSKYEGEWKHRLRDGYGTMTYPDGTKRSGYWKQGFPVEENGNKLDDQYAKREVNADNFDIQSGCLLGNCNTGTGVFAYVDGSRYEGYFSGGKASGKGTFYYPNGEQYTGEFKDGVPWGKGVLYRLDGTQMNGYWQEGEYIGEKNAASKGCTRGDCNNGSGVYVFQDGNRYIGAFQNGLPAGKGVVYYTNGERYEGEMLSGKFEGYGTLFMKDGSQVSGYWQAGVYAGNNTINSTTVVQNSNPTPAFQSDLNVWALVIGIASYHHMPVLRYTDDDAYHMYAFLKSPEGGALDDDHIRILVNEEATLYNIKSTMQQLFSKAGNKDLILLYFSGHGLQGAFLPFDFDGYNNKLMHEDIKNSFQNSDAKYKLCIADACHSGSLLAGRGGADPQLLSNYYQKLSKAGPSTALIMSSKSNETSLESSGLRQGVFSHFLIRGLKGEADKNKNKDISVQELFDYVQSNVKAYTDNMQSPVIKGDYDPDMTVAVKR
ncbi:MAG TPA: caspase family protein [Saprospiraceae bacterium]|nr:caspase family protein [Saprospiraceae bacterium]HMQ84427.1 caspase family protein [Saprospiraceae bacterium]